MVSSRKRKARRAKLVKILARRKPATADPRLPPGELLGDIAYAMNQAEVSGAAIELTHDAVITDYGYVFRLGDEYGERWQARTKVLTEFPVPPGDD